MSGQEDQEQKFGRDGIETNESEGDRSADEGSHPKKEKKRKPRPRSRNKRSETTDAKTGAQKETSDKAVLKVIEMYEKRESEWGWYCNTLLEEIKGLKTMTSSLHP